MSTAAVSPVELATVVSDSSAQESRMRTTFAAIRTFVMAFLILAGSLGAVFASPAQEAAASASCLVASNVKYGTSSGRKYILGAGGATCNSNVSQAITVRLYANGSLVRSVSASIFGKTLLADTASVWGYCGVRYQVSVTHAMSGHYNTTTWSPGYYLC